MAAATPADYPGCPVTVTDALDRGRVLRPVRWGLVEAILGLVGSFVFGLVTAIVVIVALLLAIGDWDQVYVVAGVVSIVASWVVLAGVPVLATKLRGNGPVIDLGLRLTWRDIGWGVLGGLAALVASAIGLAVTEIFTSEVTSSAGEMADDMQDSGRALLVIFGLMVLVGAPLVEELFFRGFFFATLRKMRVPAIVAVLITALVFAGFHLEPIRTLILFPTGIVLGLVRWRTGSTGASMVSHGLVNAPGTVALLLGVDVVSP